jgi:hypothetical protein
MMRRACCAPTRSFEIFPGLSIARATAAFVISWNSARWNVAFGASFFRSSCRCQQMASPSRSGSAARKMRSALRANFTRSATVFSFPGTMR